MKTIASTAAALVLVLFALPAGALITGHPETDDSNFVDIVTASATCGGVLLAPDLILTSGRCISNVEQQYPALIGYFHGQANALEDSDRNPVREVSLSPGLNPDFALLRLTAPLGPVGGMPATGFPLFRGNLEALTDVTCFALGPLSSLEAHFYGNTLASADYHVTGHVGSRLLLSGPLFHPFDAGGACFVNTPSGRQVAAVVSDAVDPMSITAARQWIAEFRTSFQILAAQSGMCVGKVPGGGGKMWQYPCADPASDFARDQVWLLRRTSRLPTNAQAFQMRTQLYANHCLGTPGGSNSPPLFGPCAPDLPTTSAWPLLLPSIPRAEQVWLMQDLDDGSVQITNQSTGMCLALGGSISPGSFVQQAPCSATAPDQRFRVNAIDIEGGPFRLSNWDAPSLCVDISGSSPSDDARVLQYTCHGDPNQNFFLGRQTGTTYHFMQPTHALGEAVEVPDYSSTPGTPIRQWHFTGEKNQQWQLSWDTFGIYRLRPRHDQQCLTAQNLDPGKLLQQPCHYDGIGHLAVLQSWIIE
jgi:hypothetical protein